MTPLYPTQKFTFKGLGSGHLKLLGDSLLMAALENFAIKIPDTLISSIIINLQLTPKTGELIKLKHLMVTGIAVVVNGNRISPDPEPAFAYGEFQSNPNKNGIDTEATISFNPKKDFVCNTLLFYAEPTDYDAVVEFSCFKTR